MNNLLIEGIEALRTNDIELAEHNFNNVLNEYPNNFDALFYSSITKSQKGDLDSSIELALKAIALKLDIPDNIYSIMYFNLGNCFYLKNNFLSIVYI